MWMSRPSNPNDLSYIYDTWLNTWRTNPYAGCVPNHLYFDTQRSTIASLLARGSNLRIAHLPESPELIQGWVCYEYKDSHTILHYLYTRDPYMAPGIIEHFKDTCLGPKGIVTHQQNLRPFRRWKHLPEIARRQRL